MDSDDEADHRVVDECDGHRRPDKPVVYLEVLDKEIDKTLDLMVINPSGRVSPTALLERRRRCHDLLSLRHTQRFFAALSGFFEGQLDLTGRHPPRFDRLVARLKDVSEDFMFIMRHCVATTKRTEELGEESDIEETSYEFDPPYLWEQFVTKWRLGTMIDCDEFRDMLADLRAVRARHPGVPKFQQSSLLDLPSELLDYIMILSDQDCLGKWSQTCSLLREHASKYVRSRLCFKLIADDIDVDAIQRGIPPGPEKVAEVRELTREAALFYRDALVKRMRKTIKRPHLLATTRFLDFSENWSLTDWMPYLGCDFPEFVAPFIEPLVILIRDLPLEAISFRAYGLPKPIWRAVCASETLHSLFLSAQGMIGWETGPSWPDAPALFNAHLKIYGEDVNGDGLWPLLDSIPNCLFLQVFGVPGEGFPMPLLRCPNITRLSVTYVWVDTLILHFADVIEGGFCQGIMHLSIITDHPDMTADIARRLFDAFRHLPRLEFLRLTGLCHAPPDLFVHLSESAPGLRSLFLHSFSSGSYQRGDCSRWPYPPSEYARAFGTFPRLNLLGLNMAIDDAPYRTSYFLQRMELGYEGAEAEDAKALRRWRARKSLSTDDDDPRTLDCTADGEVRDVVRLFAIYGRALQTIFLHTNNLSQTGGWVIERDAEGRPVTIRDGLTTSERERANMADPEWQIDHWTFDAAEAEEILGLN
ncbi:uncharacterized protein SCHCODRAFT_02672237 [Schizophyllum commune H4-8]|nr:uncharacterized protein SCHCODRAFT_02672237 [Schizophyllum commune H4-8]KAI5887069.1 hypothetical protein SCHCODRAFT_02672237 [Schizophyllum commune H4-8]